MAQPYVSRSAAAGLLRLARLKADLSQSQLAERAEVPATMISAYERDKRQPTLPTLLRLLKGAGFELRMRLAPYDPHDEALAELEIRRTRQERERGDRTIATRRGAEDVANS